MNIHTYIHIQIQLLNYVCCKQASHGNLNTNILVLQKIERSSVKFCLCSSKVMKDGVETIFGTHCGQNLSIAHIPIIGGKRAQLFEIPKAFCFHWISDVRRYVHVCAKLGQLNKRHLFSTSTMPWSKSSGRLGESVLWYYQARYKSQSYSIQYLLSQYYNICINPNGMYKSQYIPYAIYRYLYPC